MFSYDFMQNAFIAGTIVSIVAGVIGTFVVARNYAFLTHSLSEIGFAGAAFGLWIGWPALLGMMIATSTASLAIGALESTYTKHDNVTSAVSALAIGMGILFLALGHTSSSAATGILFGSVLGISHRDLYLLITLAAIVLITLLFNYRALRQLSFDEAGIFLQTWKQKSVRYIFLIMIALSISISSQLVGSLLIFVLVTLPAASAKYYAKTTVQLIGMAITFALFGTWVGLTIAYLTDLPTSFFIAVIEVLIYLISVLQFKKNA
ncbi:ABC transporter [Leuconostoc litchii]|uniref:Metal ABC transporter permease n=1 Tax=Leuconostoc litchii TaxID=1981069 RepID=A0A652NDP5_9LACO|nr:metal ABC transporter permease [Leuconostoc litchii]TYC46006.1 metal ABC transporter permease [Leuconostoc litchii]GMA70286.1 ABC transporter [Leuconostoc litchii]